MATTKSAASAAVPSAQDPNRLERPAALLKALAHPQRLAIVDLLSRIYPERLSVTKIYTTLDLSQAVTSQHLILLKKHGILTSKKEVTTVYYSLAKPSVREVIQCIEDNIENLATTR